MPLSRPTPRPPIVRPQLAVPEEIRRRMNDYMRVSYNHNPINEANFIFDEIAPPPPVNPVDRMRNVEIEELTYLIENGRGSNFPHYVTPSGAIQLFGCEIDSQRLMFVVEGRMIKVNKKRSKHLLPILKQLAASENWEIVTTTDPLPVLPGNPMNHWALSTQGQHDDEIVARNTCRDSVYEVTEIEADGMVYATMPTIDWAPNSIRWSSGITTTTGF